MKLISDAAEYGLRAAVWLAQRPGASCKVKEIAAGTQAAPGYLVKVLQAMTKAGLLAAQRGSQGGFTLLRDPDALSVLEVVEAVDPIQRIRTCPLGLAAHGSALCPMHRRLDDAMAAIEAGFAETTIGELLREPTRSKPLCNALARED